MNKRLLVSFAAILILAAGHASDAQQPKQVPRIGHLSGSSPSSVAARIEAFRQGLHELGYVEGQNIVIEHRYADGKSDRLLALAAELVRLKVNLIVTGGPAPTRAAKAATSTIPIVMALDPDPVGNGFVASLARPGGNITGLSIVAPELSGKRMELLKEILPKLARVAAVGSLSDLGNAQLLKETELAARTIGVKLQYLDVRDAKDIENAFREASKARADALLLLPSFLFNSYRTEIAAITVKSQLAAMFYQKEFVEDGGLVSYGMSYTDLFRRAATYVDKLLKGAKPADLPVEQPTKFELVINLKTAKALSLTIPQSVLLRADQIIE